MNDVWDDVKRTVGTQVGWAQKMIMLNPKKTFWVALALVVAAYFKQPIFWSW